jgi:hypothetical protein
MTEPERTPRSPEPAEGGDPPGQDRDQSEGRTPHPAEPAEGQETGGGADTPDLG